MRYPLVSSDRCVQLSKISEEGVSRENILRFFNEVECLRRRGNSRCFSLLVTSSSELLWRYLEVSERCPETHCRVPDLVQENSKFRRGLALTADPRTEAYTRTDTSIRASTLGKPPSFHAGIERCRAAAPPRRSSPSVRPSVRCVSFFSAYYIFSDVAPAEQSRRGAVKRSSNNDNQDILSSSSSSLSSSASMYYAQQ